LTIEREARAVVLVVRVISLPQRWSTLASRQWRLPALLQAALLPLRSQVLAEPFFVYISNYDNCRCRNFKAKEV
jgi:hypothetical protein